MYSPIPHFFPHPAKEEKLKQSIEDSQSLIDIEGNLSSDVWPRLLPKLDLDVTSSFSDMRKNYISIRDSSGMRDSCPSPMTEITWVRIPASYSLQRGMGVSSQPFPFKNKRRDQEKEKK